LKQAYQLETATSGQQSNVKYKLCDIERERQKATSVEALAHLPRQFCVLGMLGGLMRLNNGLYN
jgi:hypothetical protein